MILTIFSPNSNFFEFCHELIESIWKEFWAKLPVWPPQHQFSKFNHFLCMLILGKNLANFVPPTWKLHNPYCCTIPSKKPKFGFFGGKSTVCKSTYVFFLRLALVNLISSWLVWADIKFIFACWPKQSTYKPGQR